MIQPPEFCLAERACPGCTSASAAQAFRDVNRCEGIPGTWTYFKCRACDTFFLTPAPDHNSLLKLYEAGRVDRIEPADARSKTASPLRALLRILSQHLTGRPHSWPFEAGRGRHILDFGCQTGDKPREFYERGRQIAECDLNIPAIERARADALWAVAGRRNRVDARHGPVPGNFECA